MLGRTFNENKITDGITFDPEKDLSKQFDKLIRTKFDNIKNLLAILENPLDRKDFEKWIAGEKVPTPEQLESLFSVRPVSTSRVVITTVEKAAIALSIRNTKEYRDDQEGYETTFNTCFKRPNYINVRDESVKKSMFEDPEKNLNIVRGITYLEMSNDQTFLPEPAIQKAEENVKLNIYKEAEEKPAPRPAKNYTRPMGRPKSPVVAKEETPNVITIDKSKDLADCLKELNAKAGADFIARKDVGKLMSGDRELAFQKLDSIFNAREFKKGDKAKVCLAIRNTHAYKQEPQAWETFFNKQFPNRPEIIFSDDEAVKKFMNERPETKIEKRSAKNNSAPADQQEADFITKILNIARSIEDASKDGAGPAR